MIEIDQIACSLKVTIGKMFKVKIQIQAVGWTRVVTVIRMVNTSKARLGGVMVMSRQFGLFGKQCLILVAK